MPLPIDTAEFDGTGRAKWDLAETVYAPSHLRGHGQRSLGRCQAVPSPSTSPS